jgi:hypothetical protein
MQAVVEKTWIPNQADLSGNRVQGNGTILRGKDSDTNLLINVDV